MGLGKGAGRLQTLKIIKDVAPIAPKQPSFMKALMSRMKKPEVRPTPYVHISIWTGEKPRWELVSFFPQGHVSGSFFRSFIAQGMAVHSALTNKEVYLSLTDSSNIRQQYWLEKK